LDALRRVASILLMLAFLALGSGGLEHLHNLDHQYDDARQHAALGKDADSSHPLPLHSDNNCKTHAQLHLPVFAAAWTPLLICLGLFVAFLTLLTAAPLSYRPLMRLDCRGPPAC
jgi:hypothetical protein